jgi:tripartite-type tricarboxylate transporter receptor subunit TctC
MKLQRRQFLQLVAGAVTLPAISRLALAQTYRTRPVNVIVPFGAGGVSDILARLLGQKLSERLGLPFLIDNRPGAAGNIATEAVVRAPADGYTLLFITSSNAINATLYDRLNFDFIRDIAPVGSIARTSGVMEVNPSFPAKTVPEFIAHAKANVGKIAMATSGSGSGPHIWGEMFKAMAGVEMIPVPYRASPPALTDLMGGQVQVTFDPLPSSLDLIRTGKLRALAVTSAKRLEALPDVPTISESLQGYGASTWFGFGVPKNTSPEIVDRLNREINATLTDPRMKARLTDLGAEVLAGSPADFGRLIAKDTEKWRKVIRAANIKVD